LLTSATQHSRCEEYTVGRNRMSAIGKNETTVKSTKTGHELSCYAPKDFESNEFFGGGSEYLPFWATSVRLDSLI
jgi:hypothetical protein